MNQDKASAVAITTGAVAFVVAMVLNPVDRDLTYINRISAVISGTPLLLVGAVDVDVHDFAVFVFGYSALPLLIGVALWRNARPAIRQ